MIQRMDLFWALLGLPLAAGAPHLHAAVDSSGGTLAEKAARERHPRKQAEERPYRAE